MSNHGLMTFSLLQPTRLPFKVCCEELLVTTAETAPPRGAAFQGLPHFWAQQATWKIMTSVEGRWGSSAGPRLRSVCGESTRECGKRFAWPASGFSAVCSWKEG